MSCACMAASGTASLVFIDDVTADRSSSINSEVYRAIISAQIQPNAAKLIRWLFTVWMDNDPKHTAKSNPRTSGGKEMEYSSMGKYVTLPHPN